MKDKISVIMAVYNCEQTIRGCLDSLLAQTYKDWVAIVCDDGSQDTTGKILEEFRAKYPESFVVIKNERNMKLPYSLNRCLELVETDLIARMDGDDRSMPERFAVQKAFLQNHPEFDLVSSGVEVFDGEKTVGYIVRKELPDKFDAVKHSCFSHATIMTHKYVYDRLKGYSLSPRVVRAEDYDLWCRFFEAGFKGINIPDVLYTVLEDDVTLSRRKMGASINAALTALKYIKRFKLPLRYVIYPARRIATSLVPKPIYKRIHNNRLKNGHRY